MSGGGGLTVAGGGGGRIARALRLLLLLVLALAFVEYMSGSILDSTTIRTYLSMPTYNATRQLTTPRTEKLGGLWPKRTQHRPTATPEPDQDYQIIPINVINLNNNKTFIRTVTVNGTSDTNTSANVTHAYFPFLFLNASSVSLNSSSTEKLEKDLPLTEKLENKLPPVLKLEKELPLTEKLVTKLLPTEKLEKELPLIEKMKKDLLSTEKLKKELSRTEKLEKELPPTKKLVEELPQCAVNLSELGPVPVNKENNLDLKTVAEQFPEVQEGGRYAPPRCTAKDKVAIVVPFRDRDHHLAIFLNHMHPFLMKQQIDYGIFIVEQKGNKPFNRAKLMNVGFVEAQKSRPGGYDCYIFHDIDLLPLDSRNMYTCPKQPRHMSVAIDKYNYKLPYADIFGGVSALTVAQFVAVNGFSNKYWGWGGEDDDMAYRIKKKKFHIARYPMSIARYAMLHHKQQSANPKRYQLLAQTNKVFSKDGISSLEYEISKITKHHLYTNVLANIDEKS